MIIYLCLKYESNTLILSKDIEWKPFFVHTDGTMKLKKDHNSHNTVIGGFYPESNLTYIIHLCIKYEFNTLIFSEDIEWKTFFVCTYVIFGCPILSVPLASPSLSLKTAGEQKLSVIIK